MNALVSDNLPLLAGAPNGIKKLRELILELAVRGKLAPQDPNDEPASELLSHIAEEKARLIAEGKGKIKKQKPLAEIDPDEKPFELPTGWEWTRLGEITNFGITTKGESIPDDAWVLDLEDIEKDTSRLLQRACFSERNSLSDKNSFIEGDVLYGKLRPYLNKVLVADSNGFCTTEILPFRCYGPFDAHYFKLVLKSPSFLLYVNAKSYGMKMPRLGTEDGRKALFPLPPLTEQHRIVAKVDELMGLCSRLEAQQADAECAHALLVQAMLESLTRASDATDFAVSWQRLVQHFHTLFTTESSIDTLKQALLHLAVIGRLISPARKYEALDLQSVSKARRYDHPDLNYQLPVHWQVKKLEQISHAIVDCPHSTPKWTAQGIICVRTSQFKAGLLDLSAPRYVSEETYLERTQRLEPLPNDILYSREGGILGVACRIPEGVRLCLGQRMMLIRPQDDVLPEYIEMLLNSPLITTIARKMTTGGAAPRINVSVVKAYPVPLPPLEEQNLIVAKVDQLMTLCDQLKAHLTQARQLSEQQAVFLVEQAVA